MSTFDVQAKVRHVLDREAAAIREIRVDATYEAAIEALRLCTGKVVTTGMGKAGFLARKFAATLSSTGTPAVFIHPAEAAHGDLGLIAEGDCIVAFSTSGKTVEIVELVELSRHLTSARVICVTSHPESELRRLSDVVLDMGVIEEPCPLGLTPSASMAAMAAIGDALALTLMELKGVTRRDYGLRHHGGYLGHKARLANDVE
jgi:arabinose-5-phosphate isomerase